MVLRSPTTYLAIVVAVFGCSNVFGEERQPPEIRGDSAIDAIVARQSLLENVDIRYKEEIYSFPAPGASTQNLPEGTVVVNGLVSTMECKFRRCGENVMVIRDPIGASKEPGEQFTPSRIVSFSGSRIEQLVDGKVGVIRPRDKLEDHTIDVGFGLRGKNMIGFLTSDDWRKMGVRGFGDRVLFERETPPKAGGTLATRDIWEFDATNSMALTEYRREWKMLPAESWNIDVIVKMSKFSVLSDIVLPFLITSEQFYTAKSGERHVVRRVENAIDSVTVGTVECSEDTFLIAWPAEAKVLDKRIGRTIKVGEDGAKLTDEVIAETLGKRKTPPVSPEKGRWLWVIITQLVLVACIGMFIYRKRRSDAGGSQP